MSDRQIMVLYGQSERDEQGHPRVTVDPPLPPSRRKLFERFLFLNGITDPESVARLWAERVAAEAAPKGRRRRG